MLPTGVTQLQNWLIDLPFSKELHWKASKHKISIYFIEQKDDIEFFFCRDKQLIEVLQLTMML
jgi:hypothetical protein